MNTGSYIVAVTVLVACLGPAVPRQRPVAQPQQNQQAEPKAQANEAQLEAERQARVRAKALDQVRGYAARLIAPPDLAAKASGLARLAAVVCPHDGAEAEKMLLQADDSLRRIIADKEATAAAKTAARSAWGTVLSAARGCDPALAKKIEASAAEPPDTRTLEVGSAHRAMFDALREGDSQKAAQTAEDVLRKGGDWLYSDNQRSSNLYLTQLVGALNQLRGKDPAAADRVFAQAVELLRQSPVVEVSNLLALGLYVLTSPQLLEHPVGVAYRVVGGVGGVSTVDVSAARADRPVEMRRLYLEAAIDILSNPVNDPAIQAQYYVAARQLLPRVRESLPERAGYFEGAMSLLAAQVAPTVTQADFLEKLGGPYDAEANDDEKAAEAETDADRRDERMASAALRMSTSKKFGRAWDLAAKVHAAETRNGLGRLIGMREADDALGRNQPEQAERAAGQMPPCAERAIVYVGIARALAKRDRAHALDFANIALAEARTAKDLQPYILLAASAALAELEPKSATAVFSQAVLGLNALQAASEGKAVPLSPSMNVKLGRSQSYYALRAGSADGDLQSAVQALAKVDFPAAEAGVMNLTSEQMLVACLPQLAEAALAVLPRPPARKPATPAPTPSKAP